MQVGETRWTRLAIWAYSGWHFYKVKLFWVVLGAALAVVCINVVGLILFKDDTWSRIEAIGSVLFAASIPAWKWWRARAERKHSFVVALQKPVAATDNQNVLDYVTTLFTIMGFESAGLVWNAEAKVPKSAFRRAIVRLGGGIFSHDALTFEYTDQNDSLKKWKIRLEFVSEEHLELAFSALVTTSSSIKTASEKELVKFYRKYVRYRLRNAIGVIGHAESAYTLNMGKLYGAAGLLHISPYATAVGLDAEIVVPQGGFPLDYRGVLVEVPPLNSLQAKKLADSITETEVTIFADLTNQEYTNSLVSEFTKQYMKLDNGVRPESNKTISPGVEHLVCKVNGGDRCLKVVYLTGSEDMDELDTIVEERVDGSGAVVVIGMYNHAVNVLTGLHKYWVQLKKGNLKRIILTDGVVNGNQNIATQRIFWSDYWDREDATLTVSIAFPSASDINIRYFSKAIAGKLVEQSATAILQANGSLFPIETYFPVFADACSMEELIRGEGEKELVQGEGEEELIRGEGEKVKSLNRLRSTMLKLEKKEYIDGSSVGGKSSARQLIDSWKMLGDPNFGVFLYLGANRAAVIWKLMRGQIVKFKKTAEGESATVLQSVAKALVDHPGVSDNWGGDLGKGGLGLLAGIAREGSIKANTRGRVVYYSDRFEYKVLKIVWEESVKARIWVREDGVE